MISHAKPEISWKGQTWQKYTMPSYCVGLKLKHKRNIYGLAGYTVSLDQGWDGRIDITHKSCGWISMSSHPCGGGEDTATKNYGTQGLEGPDNLLIQLTKKRNRKGKGNTQDAIFPPWWQETRWVHKSQG